MRPIQYTRQQAEKLVPLLRSITREVRERTLAIETLEARWLQRERRGDGDLEGDRVRHVAAVAGHRRELTAIEKELARLGCRRDPDHSLRILIPGQSGRIQGGYAWDPSEDGLGTAAAKSGV